MLSPCTRCTCPKAWSEFSLSKKYAESQYISAESWRKHTLPRSICASGSRFSSKDSVSECSRYTIEVFAVSLDVVSCDVSSAAANSRTASCA